MTIELKTIRLGLALVLCGLLFGIGLGVAFGANEDLFKEYVAEGVNAHPDLHDEKSEAKIWRYAQRAHFHATGIAAFSLGLVILVALSGMKVSLKKFSSTLIGLGSFYPLAWFSMFLLAPSGGRDSAHHHWLTEIFSYLGTGGLLLGIFFLCGNIFLGFFQEKATNHGSGT